MLRLIVILLMLILGNAAYSQDNRIKLYSNVIPFAFPIPNYFEESDVGLKFRGLSIAYQKNKADNKTHELELKTIIKRRNEEGNALDRTYLHVRYERGKYLKKELFKILKLRVGPALKLFYINEKIDIASFNDFPVNRNKPGVSLSYFSHLEYTLNNRIHFDLNLSLLECGFGFNRYFYDNPNLIENQRTQEGFDIDLVFLNLIRFGICYTIGKKNEN